MNTVRKEDYSSQLGVIRVPVLLICGKKDILSSERVNKGMLDHMKNARIEYFNQSRHFPFIEEQERFIELTAGFLNKI